MATRDYGTGNITELSKGVYRLRVWSEPDPLTGERRRVSETFRGTRKGAQQRIQELASETRRSGPVTAMTLADVVNDFRAARVHAPKTAQGYDGVWKLVPQHMRQTKANDISTRDIDRLYAALQRDGTTASTIRKLHTLLGAAYNTAVGWGNTAHNPVPNATCPKVTRRVKVLPSADDLVRMFTLAEDPETYTWLRVLLTTGLRRGESLGLRWGDVDLARSQLVVTRTVDQNGGTRTTKTGDERLVLLDPHTTEVLSDWMTEQARRARDAGTELVADPWVFSAHPDGSAPKRGDSMYARFKKLATDAGIPDLNPHTMRHHMISVLLDAGESLEAVRRRAGHATTRMTTEVYSHLVTGADRRAANRIGQVLPVAATARHEPTQAQQPQPLPGPAGTRRPIDDRDGFAAAAGAPTRSAMLLRLGLAPTARNYRRLERRAGELGVTLPPKTNRGPRKR